ncbi:hypothetical protein SUFG_00074 [Sulfitobacter phage phiCB2047-B]|uniref:Uncharacterized protein n=1 Tax=Sulfitobacter phage phiCB2047-B TaxID=754046 RepID=M4PRR0_9CAUD|nr:hypothetical protein SUFG_00074 [Sulfitobacter phage phiCB2047-B]AGH07441.1 hypothetical protein SUFG_00074 [Sulfitobacter phage phiCB2047-B]
MPNILFASNSVSHFPGSSVRNEEWAYDANKVPYAIATPPLTKASSPKFGESETNDTWFHFTHGIDDEFWSIIDDPICEVTNKDGDRIFLLTYRNSTSTGYKIDFRSGTQSVTKSKYIPHLRDQRRTYDIRYTSTGVNDSLSLYVNEILLLEVSFSASEKNVPEALLIGGASVDTDEVISFFSEIIIADGDTRNARLDLLRPVSAGAYDNWNGPLSSLADDDPTTGMTTTLDDQNQSTILSAYGGANNISNIVQVTTTVRGINSPENLQHLIRLSGVDYLTPNYEIPFAKDYQVTDWKLNPATSQPWAAEDLTTAEFGFKSKA